MVAFWEYNLHIYYYTDKSQKIQSFPESLEKKE